MSGIVIAIGGNAISRPASLGDPRSQSGKHKEGGAGDSKAVPEGQQDSRDARQRPRRSGRELERNEIAARLVPELPLYYLTAETESVIGSMISTALSRGAASWRGSRPEICTVISHVMW